MKKIRLRIIFLPALVLALGYATRILLNNVSLGSKMYSYDETLITYIKNIFPQKA